MIDRRHALALALVLGCARPGAPTSAPSEPVQEDLSSSAPASPEPASEDVSSAGAALEPAPERRPAEAPVEAVEVAASDPKPVATTEAPEDDVPRFELGEERPPEPVAVVVRDDASPRDAGAPDSSSKRIPGGVPGGVPQGHLGGRPTGPKGGVVGGVEGSQRPGRCSVFDKRCVDLKAPDLADYALYTPQPKREELEAARGADTPDVVRAFIGVCVNAQGKVERAAPLLKGREPALTKLLVQTVKKWRYKPYMKDGKPVQVCFYQPFEIKYA
ncbi:MAG: hypothetical protein KC636_36780 [Myxococcales bacterium]|nr:hypothetical protein [Myxococcales bacterium]